MNKVSNLSQTINSNKKLSTLDFDGIRELIYKTLKNQKEREVLNRRFGLNGKKTETLESIGRSFNVTRERIRQIEKYVFKNISQSKDFSGIFSKLDSVVISKGGVLTSFAISQIFNVSNPIDKATLKILLESSEKILRVENNQINESWFSRKYTIGFIYKIVSIAYIILKNNQKPLREKDLIILILNEINSVKNIDKTIDNNFVKAVLRCTKIIGKTPDGAIGLTEWGIVNPKNTRDKAYVIFKRFNKPLHYKKLTELIREANFSKKKISIEAVHNELIRDNRFVLVGRGIYALKEWGFKSGTVAEVISEILKEGGKPLHKNDIIKKVLKRRFVKKNTILLNLQEKPQFERVQRAVYRLKENK